MVFNTLQNPKFEILTSINSEYYFVLKAGNGEVIATSEMYTTKQNCKNGIQSVKDNATIADVVDFSEL